MRAHPARRLWATLETLHDVIYFSDGVRPAGIALGLKGFWMTYFAFRAAPLGAVAAAPVVAAFGGFHPAMVGKALPDAWSRATPQACVQARAAVSTAALREHRGDGHIAALVSEGISGLEAHLLQVADGRFPDELVRQVRGWSLHEWAAAAETLRSRGLLDAGTQPRLTRAGRAVLDTIESRTDERAWTGGLSLLGEQGADEVIALLRPSVRAVVASGMLPEVSPTGLAHPG